MKIQPVDKNMEKPMKNKKAKEEKIKNALDLLPPSKFDLLHFKTLYFSDEEKKLALKFFWTNYDQA